MLAEELYAILNSDEPTTLSGPVTINNQGSDQPPLQLGNFSTGDVIIQSTKDNGNGTQGVTMITPTGDVLFQTLPTGQTPNPQEALPAGAQGGVPAVIINASSDDAATAFYSVDLYENGADRAVSRRITAFHWRNATDPLLAVGTHVFAHKITREALSPITETPTGTREDQWYVQSPGSGGGTFLGKVVSGTGDTYSVELYGNGSAQPATATVSATVPQIDPTATIPAGTWIAAVYQFGTSYQFQPPVWLTP